MSKPIHLRPRAVLDVEAAHGHYESLSPGLGQAFLDQARDKLEHLSQMPTDHAIVRRNVRATILQRFPYVLYYRIDRSIEVLAIIHGSRDEQAWKERV